METVALFWLFFKIGFLAFGGGWTIVGIIANNIIGKGWLSPEEFAQAVSASQLTPGPAAVNIATYVGFKIQGILGAFVATLGVLLPPLFIIFTIALVRKFIKFDKKRFDAALRVGTSSLIIVTLYTLGWSRHENYLCFLIAVLSFLFFVKTKIDPVYIILGSALTGMLISILEPYVSIWVPMLLRVLR